MSIAKWPSPNVQTDVDHDGESFASAKRFNIAITQLIQRELRMSKLVWAVGMNSRAN